MPDTPKERIDAAEAAVARAKGYLQLAQQIEELTFQVYADSLTVKNSLVVDPALGAEMMGAALRLNAAIAAAKTALVTELKAKAGSKADEAVNRVAGRPVP